MYKEEACPETGMWRKGCVTSGVKVECIYPEGLPVVYY